MYTTRESSLARDGRDTGFSFIEIVVTVVLLGTLIIGILAAVRTTIRVSSTSREAAEIETVLLNAVDRVTRADRLDTTIQCDLQPVVEAAVLTQGWPASSATVTQQHRAAGLWVSGACPGGVFEDGLVQRVSITIVNPDGDISRSIQVVKADE